jgi:tetratricopeptide (TPR) repeat protein
MLRLNPNDNQGIRYLLAACLLVDLGDIESLLKLLKEYDGDMSATWHYTGALATFIHQGNSPEARRRLKKALKQNPHVIPYLLLGRRLPRKLPEYVEVGGESEAVTYCADFGKAWYKTEGAITWLKAVLSQKTERQRKIGHSAIPEVFLKAFQSEEQLSKGKGGSQNQKRNMVTIYIFKVSLEDVPEIWRKIEIGGNQTLHQLHEAIFKAFERLEERPYAFFLSGKRWDSSSEYGMPGLESKAKRAKIGSLGLRVGKKLLYVFDFEYERWHSLELLGIGEEENTGKYPRIVES